MQQWVEKKIVSNLFFETFLVFYFEEVIIVFMFLKLGEDKPMWWV